MLHFDDIILYIVIGTVAFIVPGILTILNLYNLCSKTPKWVVKASLLTLIIGGIDYLLLLSMQFEPTGEWYEVIYDNQLHNLISGRYEFSISLPLSLGVIGLFIILLSKPDKLPPILSASSIGSILILNIVQIAIGVQISNQVFKSGELSVFNFLFYVFHFNILVISSTAIKKQLQYQLHFYGTLPVTSAKSRFTNFLYTKLNNIYKYSGLVFLCFLALVALMEVVFILIGQGADGPIKAFTDTADWTFSKQIPPPPKEYEGHYLCTVASGGHGKIVKPLRYGTRRGQTIIVNRQLCVANAFEDYIQEKIPKFHSLVRGVYDKYGYPLSNHITTRTRADIVYILMKPLEWTFVIFLYLVDAIPEERIRRQYKV